MQSSSPSTSSNVSTSRSLFTIFGRAENVHRKLLYELMSTVHEYLVVTVRSDAGPNATSVAAHRTIAADESLFERIHRSVEQIFLNGLRVFKPDVSCAWYQQPFAHCKHQVAYFYTDYVRSWRIYASSKWGYGENWTEWNQLEPRVNSGQQLLFNMIKYFDEKQ